MKLNVLCSLVLGLAALSRPGLAQDRQIWSAERANQWYAGEPWLIGSNFIPANAVNVLEMWQAQTFDPVEIDRELAWAQGLGMNTMRIYLHDLLWAQDPAGLTGRMQTLLQIADRRGIRPIFVLFDSCWDPEPRLGPQHPPVPGVHNSGWVQAPGRKGLEDPAERNRLEAYVEGVVGAFASDPRILAWDVWNEPDNENAGYYAGQEPARKVELVAAMLPQVFAWARSRNPVQPLTSALWRGDDWSRPGGLSVIQKIQLAQSDILTFHDYGWPESFQRRVDQLRAYGRPIICTEFMARALGSTFDGDLPIAKRANVGMINWGLVAGKTQTSLPWDSWQRPYVLIAPPVWFHDVFQRDGKPYRDREIQMIRAYAASPKGVAPDGF